MKRRRSYSYGKPYTGTRRRKRARSSSYNRPSVARTRGALVNTESKYFDVTIEPVAIPKLIAGGNWGASNLMGTTTMAGPVRGSAITERNGNKIFVRKLAVRGTIQCAEYSAGANSSHTTRLLLVQDKQTNGSASAGSAIISSNTGAGGKPINDWQNVDNFGRYRVLKDIRINVPCGQAVYDGTNKVYAGEERNFRMTVKFKKPICVRFSGSTAPGAIADVVDNSFQIFGAQDNANGPVWRMHCQTRCYYVDP